MHARTRNAHVTISGTDRPERGTRHGPERNGGMTFGCAIRTVQSLTRRASAPGRSGSANSSWTVRYRNTWVGAEEPGRRGGGRDGGSASADRLAESLTGRKASGCPRCAQARAAGARRMRSSVREGRGARLRDWNPGRIRVWVEAQPPGDEVALERRCARGVRRGRGEAGDRRVGCGEASGQASGVKGKTGRLGRGWLCAGETVKRFPEHLKMWSDALGAPRPANATGVSPLNATGVSSLAAEGAGGPSGLNLL